MKLSKSDYVLGLKCPNALWFKRFRKDLEPEVNQAVFDTGHMVGELACKRFPGGTRITAKPWENESITQTQAAIDSDASAIFEAVLMTASGEFCAVDILRNNNDGTWDIIEVKSNTNPKEYHYLDISFQRYVCEMSGLKIKNCFIMTLNSAYVRRGELNLGGLFAMHDAHEELQLRGTVETEIKRIREFLTQPELGVAISKGKCNKFYDCQYKYHCWKDIPEYSVFDAFRGKTADEIYAEHGADLRKIPSELYAKGACRDIECFINDCEIANLGGLREFVSGLRYPLCFLDYETIGPAVPLFYNSRPYQALPFQFSLHIQREPGGALEHIEFLHDKQTDPRPDIVFALIAACGTEGSIVVYNQGFEEGVNNKLAADFPEHADAIQAINNRMVDLLVPFKSRQLYRPRQNGSASIKETLPAFIPEMSYANLEIKQGTEASEQFMRFMTGKQAGEETSAMMTNLREYCAQDTLAMVKLLDVIRGFTEQS
jgi:CRISPR/Cas system-associated exonuclease Cas4 (RecB family)